MLREVVRTGVSLDSVYGETIQRIREQEGGQSRLGMEVLAWVSHSVRPLRISELRHALAIEVASKDLDRENIPPLDTVLGSCLGLVVVDEETSTVRLIHYTLQEHLFADHILPNAHQTLAEACLAYLHYEWVKGLPVDVDPNLSDMPFLEYSSSYWGIHAKEGLSGGVKSLALELSNLYDTHISSTLLFNRINCFGSSSATPYLFTGLHCASYFGIIEVVTSLIEMKNCHINQRDCIGHTPLMWAARQGNEEVVGLLLTRGDVVPDEPDNDGRTALSWASSLGYEKVVRLLLARGDVNPDKVDNYGQTALWWASQGSKDVGRLLLTSGDFNLDRSHNHGQNVLNWASALVYEGIVRTLFTWENVNLGESHNGCQAMVQWVSRGDEGVVRSLITLDDLNPDTLNHYDQAPHAQASSHGNREIVRLLLAQGNVNLDELYSSGRTAPLLALLDRYGTIIELLLPRTNVHSSFSTTMIFAVVSGVGLLHVSNTSAVIHFMHTLITLVFFLRFPGQKYPPCLTSQNRCARIAALLQRRKSVVFSYYSAQNFRALWVSGLALGVLLSREGTLRGIIYIIQIHAFPVFLLLVFGRNL